MTVDNNAYSLNLNNIGKQFTDIHFFFVCRLGGSQLSLHLIRIDDEQPEVEVFVQLDVDDEVWPSLHPALKVLHQTHLARHESGEEFFIIQRKPLNVFT